MFRTVPLSIVSSLSLYTQQGHMSYRLADSLRESCQQACMTYTIAVYSEKLEQAVRKYLWLTPLLCVQ